MYTTRSLYIPSNLNLKSLLPHHLQDDPIHQDYLAYLITLIYEQRVFYKDKSEYVSLKAEFLRNVIRNYIIYRQILIDHGVIDCDYIWIRNQKSYGYKLLPPHSEVRHQRLEIQSKRFKNKLLRWRKKGRSKVRVHKHIESNLKKIMVRYEDALESIKDLDNDSFNRLKIVLDRLYLKEFYLIPDLYGRVHTNITNLKSSLRKFLKAEGKSLVNLDITNSQPLLLLYCTIRSIRCAKNIEYASKINKDMELYQSLVESGKLYPYLMDKLRISNKRKLKETLFKGVFFGKKTSARFARLFPTIAAFIKKIKKKNYKRLAWIMQRMESKLMIGNICGRIMDEHPDVFFTTIHDSILTTSGHVDKIKQIMHEEFSKIGISPTIKTEVCE